MASDAGLLRTIAQRNVVQVNLTITTTDEKLARLVEPLAPRPELRLRAVRSLASAGIPVTVLSNPVMPFITDSEANLDAVCQAAKEAGAVSFTAHPLFLKPCSKAVFMPFIAERFPRFVGRYRAMFANNAYLRGFYAETIAARVKAIVARHGMARRDPSYAVEQLSLW